MSTGALVILQNPLESPPRRRPELVRPGSFARPSESFILPLDHTFLGSEDGENSLPEDSNEPLASVHGTDGDPQGTDDGEVRAVGHLGADEPALNVDQVIARFVDETKNRFRPDTPTAGDYSTAFRRFAKTVGLDSFSRKQLTPKRAHKIITDYMATMRPGSKRWILTALQRVWVYGGLGPWPIDIGRDFGRSLPKPQRREAPPDAEVLPFAKALAKEPDAYVRVFVRMMLTYGLRPVDQLGAIRWGNIRYDESGRPYAFVARGVEEGFKTGSPWIAHIPSDLATDLMEWNGKSPNSTPEALILPRMGKHGKIADAMRIHSNRSTEDLWKAYTARHGIRSALTMAHMRHFVKRHRRKVLDPAILAYWSGHDAKSEGGGMSLHYGTNLPVQEVLEEQSREWPEGPIGDLIPVRVLETAEITPQMMNAIREYMKGGSDSELTTVFGEARKKATPFVRP